jgi:thiamine biosynthesis lipoprotein
MLRLAVAAMATRFELLVPGDARAEGEAALALIEEAHQRYSRFSADSWLSHVNRTAAYAPVRCDDESWSMLMDARDVWHASGGAFDVTRGHGDALVLDLERYTVAFAVPGVSIDLGGIAKGHAVDAALQLLRDAGVTTAFIHGGTSSGAGMGRVWRVATQEAARSGEERRVIEVCDSAFSVSDAGSQTEAHIVDTCGHGGTVHMGSVLVTGPSARLADAWSTALVVNPHAAASLPHGYRADWLDGSRGAAL